MSSIVDHIEWKAGISRSEELQDGRRKTGFEFHLRGAVVEPWFYSGSCFPDDDTFGATRVTMPLHEVSQERVLYEAGRISRNIQAAFVRERAKLAALLEVES